MDQYTRRIIGFGVHAGTVDSGALCRMFNRAIRGQRWMPKYLSADNDPLYRFHQWQANLRVLEATEIKSIPYVPLFRPFMERLIGTLRREYLDHMLFWKTAETSCSISGPTSTTTARIPSREGRTPDTPLSRPIANPRSFRWQPHLSGPLSDTGGCLISQRFALAAVSGRPLQKPRMKSPNVRVLVAARFAAPIVSLPPYQFARDRENAGS
jgi:transposase InsO family protein